MPIHRAVARATGDVEALADKRCARGARRGHVPRKALAKVLRAQLLVRGQAREERTRQRVSGKDGGARARLQSYAGHELREADGVQLNRGGVLWRLGMQ